MKLSDSISPRCRDAEEAVRDGGGSPEKNFGVGIYPVSPVPYSCKPSCP